MLRAVVIKGHLIGPKNVELDEAARQSAGDVEVVVHTNEEANGRGWLSDFLMRIPAGSRTKEDIDEQIRAERDAWEGR